MFVTHTNINHTN